MSAQRLFGIILLVVGVGVLVIGVNASHSVADQVSDTFTGKFTQSTAIYIVGGLAAAVAGLALLMFGGKRGA